MENPRIEEEVSTIIVPEDDKETEELTMDLIEETIIMAQEVISILEQFIQSGRTAYEKKERAHILLMPLVRTNVNLSELYQQKQIYPGSIDSLHKAIELYKQLTSC